MSQSILHTTGDSWKEMAKETNTRLRGTAQMMISRTNDIWPFSKAKGVLDNGCGTGTIMSNIIETHGAEIEPSTKLVAADFSDHMLESFREMKKSRSQGPGDVWDRIEIRNLDAHDLSGITSSSLSHVTGGMLYFLLSDPRKALEETNRVLCPGGVLTISNGKTSQHIDALCEAVEDVRPGTHLNLLSGVWTTEAGVKDELAATGFIGIETHLIESSVDYRTHKQFAETLLKMPVLKNVTGDFSKDEMTEFQANVVRHLKDANPAEPGSVRGITIVALARKPS